MYTATALDTLALLWHELQQLNLPLYLRNQKPPNEKVIKHHTEPEFHRMYTGVVQCIKSQHIYAICIDHAEKLDEYTLEWLWHIHEEVDQQFALLLCAELQKNEDPGTPFYRLLNNVPNVLEARLGNPVLLPIEAEEFQLKVLPKILRSLEATLAPEVRPRARAFREDFWEWTQGNWHLINRHTWLFDDELGGDKRRPRLITQDVIDRVYARLKGLKLPSKED